MPNLIPNFIKKIEFESNFKVVELEFELEPCDIASICIDLYNRYEVWTYFQKIDIEIAEFDLLLQETYMLEGADCMGFNFQDV